MIIGECRECARPLHAPVSVHCSFCGAPNAANTAPDPALLALARFGARIANDYHRGKYGFVSADGDWLDIDAASAGVKEYQGAADLATGIASAIAALLAPDGAASEGVTP